MADIKTFSEQVIDNLEKVVVGKRESIEMIVIGLLLLLFGMTTKGNSCVLW